jgi:hypothetical protein
MAPKRTWLAAIAATAMGVVLPLSGAFASPSLCDSIVGNLIGNCGFETGDFTDWTVIAGDTFVTTAFAGYTPNSGAYFAALGDVSGTGSLAQSITDTTGQLYTLTYFLASKGDDETMFSAAWDGVTLAGSVLVDPNSASTYVEYSFTVLGTGSDTLTLHETDVPSYMALDDVSLTPTTSTTPLPGALPLFGSALGGLGLFGWRRKRTPKAVAA